jgi:hypothetical protein
VRASMEILYRPLGLLMLRRLPVAMLRFIHTQ